MSKKILYAVIAAAMLLSMTALSGCDSDATDTSSVNLSDSNTESVVYEIDSESDSDSIDSSSDEETAASEKGADSNPDNDNTKSEEATSSKTASSKTVSSKTASSKEVSSKSTSSKSESSKASSDDLTDDEALEIVLNNTYFTKDELDGIEVSEENGERFHNVYFCENGNYENGTYVFFVRDRDGKFFTYEEFNENYSGISDGVTEDEALDIVFENTEYTMATFTGVTVEEADGDKFYAVTFLKNGTYVFYVRQKDGRFYTYDDFNKAYNEFYDGYIGHD